MYPKALNLMLLHPLTPEGTQKGGKRKKEEKKKEDENNLRSFIQQTGT